MLPRFSSTVLRRSILLSLCALAAALTPAVPASAAFFAGDVIDGPSADIAGVGDVDLARDGTGAVVYVKDVGGVAHVFASRLANGHWSAPEQLDAGFVPASGEPVVAAADGGRLVAAFTSGGTLYTVARPAGASAWTAPAAVAAPAQTPSIDMSINGVAYLVWAGGGDVRGARMDRDATTFAPLSAPLDINAGANAGAGAGRPDVSVSADGTALAAWGEAGHVYARRLYGLNVSTDPQDLTLDSFEGHAGGVADSPDVDMEDDSSFAWVAFRQAFADGSGQTTRVIARRLVGSAFDPPVDVGGGGFGAEGAGSPRVDVSGTGDALFASATTGTNTPFATVLRLDSFVAPLGLAAGQAVASQPQPAIAENADGLVSWMQSSGAGDPVALHARLFDVAVPADDGAISNPAFGAIDPSAGFDSAGDRAGDVVTVAVQGTGDQRRLVAGGWDRPPTSFALYSSSHWRRPSNLVWAPSFDLWGPLSYSVQIDGKAVATSTTNHAALTAPLSDGVHRWRVIATDFRGQSAATRTGILRLDGTPPQLTLRVSGKRKAGATLKFTARAQDLPGRAPARKRGGEGRARAAQLRASGVSLVRFDFGDRSAPVLARRVAHVFRRGTFTVTVTAIDRAGNRTVVTKRLRIRK